MCENAVKLVDLQSLTALHSFEEVLLLLIIKSFKIFNYLLGRGHTHYSNRQPRWRDAGRLLEEFIN